MSTDPTLRCEDLKMRYPDTALWALGSDDAGVSLGVAEGELFALLGPSGCGKTTTLRIVGGFVHPTSGTVEIGGVDVTGSPAHSRPTNTVFQNYALFPHKTIAENVAFGLRIKRTPKPERERRVAEALEMVGLTDYARRKVSELSGGQAQRAALARAIVNRPSVLLLDEPLGALDLKLRRQMQDELVRIKGETNISFVHVTHDQEEACAIADRIAVMDAGQIVQIATPLELYRRPRTTYVAEFINAGTVVRGETRRDGDVFEVVEGALLVRGPAEPSLNGSVDFAAVLPPDRVTLAPSNGAAPAADHSEVTGKVERVVFTGTVFDCYLAVGAGPELRATLTIAEVMELGGAPERGTEVHARWLPEDVLFVECHDKQEVLGDKRRREDDG
jgi:spermidine/putrescine transport system ATP-binding protein